MGEEASFFINVMNALISRTKDMITGFLWSSSPEYEAGIQVGLICSTGQPMHSEKSWPMKFKYRRAFPAQLSDLFLGESLSDWPHMWPLSWSFPWMRPSLLRWFNWPENGYSEIRLEKGRFVIYLDVKHFSPDELSVEVSEDYVTVHGKHEHRQDDNAFTAKEFLRKYRLPAGVSSADITSSLSSDGVLTITAPRSAIGPESNIPISFNEKKLKN